MARIVFDLDGTLIDSAPDIRGIANRLLAERDLDPIDLDTTRRFIGKGLAGFIQKPYQVKALKQTILDAVAQGAESRPAEN